MIRQAYGRLAQLVERFVYTEDVGSSSLSSPTISPQNSNFPENSTRSARGNGISKLRLPLPRLSKAARFPAQIAENCPAVRQIPIAIGT